MARIQPLQARRTRVRSNMCAYGPYHIVLEEGVYHNQEGTNTHKPRIEFLLGMSINQVIQLLSSLTYRFEYQKVELDNEQPDSREISISIPRLELHLWFDSLKQQLMFILLSDMKLVKVMFGDECINNRLTGRPCDVEKNCLEIFGRESRTSMVTDRNLPSDTRERFIHYPGVQFSFQDNEIVQNSKTGAPTKVVTKTCLKDVSIFRGRPLIDGNSRIARCYMPLKLYRHNVYLKNLQVYIDQNESCATFLCFKLLVLDSTEGVKKVKRNITFGDTCQDVMSSLGCPTEVYYKEPNTTRIRTSSGVRMIPTSEFTDYFYNYFTLGVDVLFDGRTHRVKKFVLHTNSIYDVQFGRYHVCNFSLKLFERPAESSTCMSDPPNYSMPHTPQLNEPTSERPGYRLCEMIKYASSFNGVDQTTIPSTESSILSAENRLSEPSAQTQRSGGIEPDEFSKQSEEDRLFEKIMRLTRADGTTVENSESTVIARVRFAVEAARKARQTTSIAHAVAASAYARAAVETLFVEVEDPVRPGLFGETDISLIVSPQTAADIEAYVTAAAAACDMAIYPDAAVAAFAIAREAAATAYARAAAATNIPVLELTEKIATAIDMECNIVIVQSEVSAAVSSELADAAVAFARAAEATASLNVTANIRGRGSTDVLPKVASSLSRMTGYPADVIDTFMEICKWATNTQGSYSVQSGFWIGLAVEIRANILAAIDVALAEVMIVLAESAAGNTEAAAAGDRTFTCGTTAAAATATTADTTVFTTAASAADSAAAITVGAQNSSSEHSIPGWGTASADTGIKTKTDFGLRKKSFSGQNDEASSSHTKIATAKDTPVSSRADFDSASAGETTSARETTPAGENTSTVPNEKIAFADETRKTVRYNKEPVQSGDNASTGETGSLEKVAHTSAKTITYRDESSSPADKVSSVNTETTVNETRLTSPSSISTSNPAAITTFSRLTAIVEDPIAEVEKEDEFSSTSASAAIDTFTSAVSPAATDSISAAACGSPAVTESDAAATVADTTDITATAAAATLGSDSKTRKMNFSNYNSKGCSNPKTSSRRRHPASSSIRTIAVNPYLSSDVRSDSPANADVGFEADLSSEEPSDVESPSEFPARFISRKAARALKAARNRARGESSGGYSRELSAAANVAGGYSGTSSDSSGVTGILGCSDSIADVVYEYTMSTEFKKVLSQELITTNRYIISTIMCELIFAVTFHVTGGHVGKYNSQPADLTRWILVSADDKYENGGFNYMKLDRAFQAWTKLISRKRDNADEYLRRISAIFRAWRETIHFKRPETFINFHNFSELFSASQAYFSEVTAKKADDTKADPSGTYANFISIWALESVKAVARAVGLQGRWQSIPVTQQDKKYIYNQLDSTYLKYSMEDWKSIRKDFVRPGFEPIPMERIDSSDIGNPNKPNMAYLAKDMIFEITPTLDEIVSVTLFQADEQH